jgi:hypothetical protein
MTKQNKLPCFFIDIVFSSKIKIWQNQNFEKKETRGLPHCVTLPFTLLKMYLKAKEELWKFKHFTMHKI